MITQEQIQEIIKDSLPSIKQSVVDEVKTTMASSLRWAIGDNCKEILAKFIKEEIEPELYKHLNENKEGIRGAVIKATDEIMKTVTESLVLQVNENLKNSWKREKLVEAIFK